LLRSAAATAINFKQLLAFGTRDRKKKTCKNSLSSWWYACDVTLTCWRQSAGAPTTSTLPPQQPTDRDMNMYAGRAREKGSTKDAVGPNTKLQFRNSNSN
ncbi:unnamed protein product, partial [Nesidiocoris tenuis]